MREEKGGNQPRREKRPLPLRNPKSCIPSFFLLGVQQTCKATLFFLVARTWECMKIIVYVLDMQTRILDNVVS